MTRVVVWLLAILTGGFTFVDRNVNSPLPAKDLLAKIEEGREHLKNESVKLITGWNSPSAH